MSPDAIPLDSPELCSVLAETGAEFSNRLFCCSTIKRNSLGKGESFSLLQN
jgi:hypothetical protein